MQPHPVAAGLAAAVARREPQRLAAALTETVRLRALLPGGPVESHGRADVAARFHGWFADFDTVQVLESAGEAVADRATDPLPPRPESGGSDPLGLHPDRHLQARRRSPGGDRPVVFRLSGDSRS